MRAIVVICVACWGGCSGPSFTPMDCDEAECAGESSGGSTIGGRSQGGTGNAGEGGEPLGGSNTGGSDTGGSSTGGSDTGGSDTGGSDTGGSNTGGSNTGGSNTGGSDTGGTAGAGTAGFPATRVLDEFNRDAPELGDDWTGSSHLYQVVSQALHCPADYCQGVFWQARFDVVQEAFATLVSFSEFSPEINVILKAQGELDCDLIEVFYAPPTEEVLLEACWDDAWRTLGRVGVRLEPGDQLGGRARADGFIEIFRNGELLDTIDANDYPFIALGGYIGVNGIVGAGEDANVWDDFGGGSL